jgi:hypothetical protein
MYDTSVVKAIDAKLPYKHYINDEYYMDVYGQNGTQLRLQAISITKENVSSRWYYSLPVKRLEND